MILGKNDDIYYMQQAILEAEKAFTKSEIPIGAVIVSNYQIIARAHNLTETLTDVTAHAEILAITEASAFLGCKYLIGCAIYVTIQPCQMCFGALILSKINRIIYGASKKEKYKYTPKTTTTTLHPKISILGGVLDIESVKLMRNFFKQKR